MEGAPEPEWVTAKQVDDSRISATVRGLWLTLILFAAGLYLSDAAIHRGLAAVTLLDVLAFVALAFVWRTRGVTLGTVGIGISLAVFQLAVFARGVQEPFADGTLLALSMILFVASLLVGNRQATKPSST